jgi:hypothetical protein
VKSFSREKLKQYPNDVAFWEVSVTCLSTDLKPTIRQQVKGEQWCAKEIEGYCNNQKLKAAAYVCKSSYISQLQTLKDEELAEEKAREEAKKLAQEKKAKAKQAELAKKEKQKQKDINSKALASISATGQNSALAGESVKSDELLIEEQRILIEQQRLDLRRKELELNKQALELQKIKQEKQANLTVR